MTRPDTSGLAVLGGLTFRINPSEVAWNFKINSRVQDTVGGRVVQILGATLSDITVVGYYGEDRSQGSVRDTEAGRSWRLAEEFVRRVQDMMEQQSKDAQKSGLMQQPVRFYYPPKKWDFNVYIKALTDIDGGGTIQHRTGKFSYGYALTLFVVEDLSADLKNANQSYGAIAQQKQQAIRDYIARISQGIGWKRGPYNDPNFVVGENGEVLNTNRTLEDTKVFNGLLGANVANR